MTEIFAGIDVRNVNHDNWYSDCSNRIADGVGGVRVGTSIEYYAVVVFFGSLVYFCVDKVELGNSLF